MAQVAAKALDTVLPLRTGGDGHPLFCAHPVVGLSWCYLAVLPHIDAAHPVYGIQARGLRRPEPLPATLAEAARDFADQIRLTQPSGPYHLLGWSLGGNVAFAIAEELERRGHEVGLLVILDSTPLLPDGMPTGDEVKWELYNWVLNEFGYTQTLRFDDTQPEAKVLSTARGRRGLGFDDWPDQRILALLRIVRHNVLLVDGHRPGRVHCSMLFISATENPPTLREKLDRWQPYVGGPIHAVEVGLDHHQLLRPDAMERIGPAVTGMLSGIPPVPHR
jgi:thioesterase domain-containing protein